MEALLALLGIAAFLYWFILPGLAVRIARRTQQQVEDLEAKVQRYEHELYALRLQLEAVKRAPLPPVASRDVAAPASAPVSAPQSLPALAPLFAPSPLSSTDANTTSPAATSQASEVPIAAAVATPPSLAPATEPARTVAAEPALTVATEPAAAAAATSAFASTEPTPPPAATAPVTGATSREAPSSPPPITAVPEPSPEEIASPFDIEKFIGVRGAAWLGAIALAIAGTLFAKYSIENNLIPPALRIAFLILLGLVALVGSEVFFRPRYPATASPVCGAGIAILYAAFFAGHSAYDLFSLPLTFALMLLTTVVAGLLSVRYDSVFIAVLGLLGGFATPLLLSTGKDRPIGLFAYVLLLDFGFLAISIRKRWNGLVWLSFVATLLLEVAWAAKQLSPAKLPIALSIFFLFGIVYFLLPSLVDALTGKTQAPDATKPTDSPPASSAQLVQLGILAGLAPLLFGMAIAGQRHYTTQWPLLLGYTALLDVALVLVGIRRRQRFLSLAAALSTFLTLALYLGARPSSAEPLPMWTFSLCLIGLAGLFGAAGRIHDLWFPANDVAAATPPEDGPATNGNARIEDWLPTDLLSRVPLELSGYVGIGGLLFYVLYLVATLRDGSPLSGAHDPMGPTSVVLVAATLFLGERSRPQAGRVAWLSPFFAFLLSGTCLLWILLQCGPDASGAVAWGPAHLLRALSLPLLLSVLAGLFGARRSQQASRFPLAAQIAEVSAAVLAALSAAGVILLSAVGPTQMLPMTPGLGLSFVVLYCVLLWLSALRRDITLLLPLVLALVCGEAFTLVAVYHQSGHPRGPDTSILLWLVGCLLALTAAPLLALSRRPLWRVRRGAYLASALAGPALFLPILQLVEDAVGKRAIGLLPLGFATLSVLGLAAVQRLLRMPLPDRVTALFPDDVRQRRSLGNQALFAAAALGFVAVAIPLQLDRQWIIVAWALEAAAVWWLYRRLPHIGLKYFGVALFAAVILRLYPDAEFRHYNERGMILLNWLLYTYGVPAACFLVGARGLSAVEATYRRPWEEPLPVGGARFAWYQLSYLVGLLSVFVLINLEIADAFSSGRYIDFSWEHSYARDLTVSLSWGLYALLLLSIGMWQRSRALRFVSLGFMMLTIGKVFLYDLSNIRGIYRPLSFLGLAVSLIVVSLLYQRFVFRKETKPTSSSP